MIAGVDQSMRRSTRKPRLNHDENRCTKSWSTGDKSSRCTIAFIRSSRIATSAAVPPRSEEHTSELQSQSNLVCRLLLEKKKKKRDISSDTTTLAVDATR